MVCILASAASVSEHAGLSPGNMQQTLSMAQGCKPRIARRGAGSNQASSTSQAGAQAQQEASPSLFGHRLKYATVAHCLHSETQLSTCAHCTNLIATTQSPASLTYNRQKKGQIYQAALGWKARYGVLHDAFLYSTAKVSFLMCCICPLQTSQTLSCQRLRL